MRELDEEITKEGKIRRAQLRNDVFSTQVFSEETGRAGKRENGKPRDT